MVLSSLSFRVNLPTTFTFLSVFEQILRLPPCIRTEACFLAVRSPSPSWDTCESFEAGDGFCPQQPVVDLQSLRGTGSCQVSAGDRQG